MPVNMGVSEVAGQSTLLLVLHRHLGAELMIVSTQQIFQHDPAAIWYTVYQASRQRRRQRQRHTMTACGDTNEALSRPVEDRA
ncbi:hypothetical protein E4U57_004905 [Claviceps arundinis]|uniref:Uncharacterized protein n=1 Tax=Claviceps arundinis TaxID=1623583 RepID=A0ABQ7P469_9HYPO|nr:hypothetical protein E4U57_004905 [Claviceps arundinis]